MADNGVTYNSSQTYQHAVAHDPDVRLTACLNLHANARQSLRAIVWLLARLKWCSALSVRTQVVAMKSTACAACYDCRRQMQTCKPTGPCCISFVMLASCVPPLDSGLLTQPSCVRAVHGLPGR